MNRHRLVFLICMALALAQGIWAVRVLSLDTALQAQISLHPPFEFLTGTAWAVVFGSAAWRVARRRPFALRFALISMGGFALFSALRLLIWAQADYDRHRLPFLWITLALAGLMTLVLHRRKSTVVESE